MHLLQTPSQVRDAAIRLGKCADELAKRYRKDFDAGKITADEAIRGTADELLIRQHSITLFVLANDHVIDANQDAQKDLKDAIEEAKIKIAQIAKFRDVLTLVGKLIALGTAVISAQLLPIVAAVGDLASTAKKAK